jgi:hypothetical protein
MEKGWVKVNGNLPESGQEVLTYYYNGASERDQIDILQYFKKGDVLYTKIDRDPQKPKAKRFLNTLFNKDLEVIAEEDGFYIYEWNEVGDTDCRKHANIITHWKALPEPPIQSTICWICKNSVPNPENGVGCSWSNHSKPVEGWVARPSDKYEDGYCVIECPEFIKG